MTDDKGRIQLRGIHKSFGDFEALKDVNLDIAAREFFALLGPSGSGKSTTLRVIAGLETPDSGTMTVDGIDITHAPPGERDVAMVFQNYALYPHMTLGENIGFPLKMGGVPKRDIPGLVRDAAKRLKIDQLLHRRPGQLSGGQQQRCALARAIVRKPRLFLLDEPLSNLDAQLRLDTRVELKNLHRSLDVTTIYVTHDQEEAMTIADRMAIFMDGEIVQVGTPQEVFDRPNTVKVAAFIGSPAMNLLPATLDGHRITVTGSGYSFELPKAPDRTSESVTIGIRPSHIHLAETGLSTQLFLTENLGETMLLNLRFGEQMIKLRLPDVRHFDDTEALHLTFDLDHVHLFDSQSGQRID